MPVLEVPSDVPLLGVVGLHEGVADFDAVLYFLQTFLRLNTEYVFSPQVGIGLESKGWWIMVVQWWGRGEKEGRRKRRGEGGEGI